jgi:uncharacterized protein involved in exopolysaccharide biosynthesis
MDKEPTGKRDDEGMSLRDTLNILYRRIYLLKFLLVALPLGVLAVCFLVEPLYETTGKVIVTGKKENSALLRSPTEGASSYLNLNVDEIDLNSEMELLKSLDLWVRVVKKLNLVKPDEGFFYEAKKKIEDLIGLPEPTKQAGRDAQTVELAEMLMKQFKVVPGIKSRVIDVSFRYSDPAKARQILSTLLELYIPYHVEVYSVPGAEGFFSGQGDMYKTKLEAAEKEVSDFKRKWGISLPDKQKAELLASVSKLNDSLIEVNANLNQYQFIANALEKGGLPTGQLASSISRGNENTVINIIISQLLRAEQKQAQAAELYSVDSRDYKTSLEMVTDLKAKLANVIQNEIDTLIAKGTSLEASLKAKQDELQILEDKSEKARQLQLAATVAKERYIQYLTKEEEARLETSKIGKNLVNVSVVGKPSLPAEPVFPKTLLFVLGAFVAAFPLGIGAILVANFFDHTFDNPNDIENNTNFKVLASIGNLKKA